MTLMEVKKVVGDLPWMTMDKARRMSSHLTQYRPRRILEIGHYHGVSTCYLASIVREQRGRVMTIDFPMAKTLQPNAETLLQRCGLQAHVEIVREAAGAEWHLMRLLERNVEPFDFCFLDGGHTWKKTGFLFLLVERLLRPNGWILFDDLQYSIESSSDRHKPWTQTLTKEEREARQVKKVWDLLVKRHPAFTNFIEDGTLGWCQKRPAWR